MFGRYLKNHPVSEESFEKQRKKSVNQEVNQMLKMANGFEKSLVETAQNNARTWRYFGIGSLVVAGMAVAAVMGLTPFKEVIPFVARVNDTTGAVDILTTIKNKQMKYEEVINRYWLAMYVRYRESYDWDKIQATYDATNLLSAPQVQAVFKAFYNSPAAPHKILKQHAKVVVKVTNISFVGDMAQVRFEKRVIPVTGEENAQPIPPQKMIATIAFEFKSTPMKEADRLINPLGFQVLSYDVTEEVAP